MLHFQWLAKFVLGGLFLCCLLLLGRTSTENSAGVAPLFESLPHARTLERSGRTREIANCIRNPSCRRTFIVAHRCNGLGAPENSRSAVLNAIKSGIPIVETDLRLSKNGEIFLLHDDALDRTTSLSGKISKTDSRQLSRAFLENGEALPRFREVYALSRGKVVLNLDFKDNVVEEVADWIGRNGSFDDVIFFAMTDQVMESVARMKKKYPSLLAMPRVYDPYSVERLEGLFGRLPEIVEAAFPSAELMGRMHEHETKVYADILGRDRVEFLAGLSVHILLDRKADFIETDSPLWLAQAFGDTQDPVY